MGKRPRMKTKPMKNEDQSGIDFEVVTTEGIR